MRPQPRWARCVHVLWVLAVIVILYASYKVVGSSKAECIVAPVTVRERNDFKHMDEERQHMYKFLQCINDRGGQYRI